MHPTQSPCKKKKKKKGGGGGDEGDKQKANEVVLFTGMEMLICCKYTSLPYSLWEWFLALKLHVVLYNHKIIYYYSRLLK